MIGIFYGPSELQEHVGREARADLMRLHGEGKIHPLVAEELKFEGAAAGLDKLAGGGAHGNLVVHI